MLLTVRSGRLWDIIFMRGVGNKHLEQFESLGTRSNYIYIVFLYWLSAHSLNAVRSIHSLGVPQHAAEVGEQTVRLRLLCMQHLSRQKGSLKPVVY